MNGNQLRWILQTRYDLKFHCVRKSQWRKKAAEEWIKNKIGTADEFVKMWVNLDQILKSYQKKKGVLL